MGGEMTIEAMRFAAAGKIIDDQNRLIDRLYSERDEAHKLAEEWRDIAEECAGMIACSIEGAGFELDKCPPLPWEEK
jgi:hypothetical protein